MHLEFHRIPRDPWSVLVLCGDLDMAGAPELRREVAQMVAAGDSRLVLDLTAVDFIDSTGLGAVIGSLRRTRSHDGDLVLVCPEPRLQRVFEMCDLDRVFELHESVDAAMGASA
ncbi:MAG: STAS domain-containing protein [Actinobacteria bacterium]|nr:STAS domain-containing protein [Actinomycetota bacterium]